jgi:hypothetical protein
VCVCEGEIVCMSFVFLSSSSFQACITSSALMQKRLLCQRIDNVLSMRVNVTLTRNGFSLSLSPTLCVCVSSLPLAVYMCVRVCVYDGLKK